MDQFIKRDLRIKHYIRYTDDFVIIDSNNSKLETIIPIIQSFLRDKLKLELHPNKVSIRTIQRGADFLGYVVLPYHRVLRIKTKKRMLKKVSENNISSYLGILKHCNGRTLEKEIIAIASAHKPKTKS